MVVSKCSKKGRRGRRHALQARDGLGRLEPLGFFVLNSKGLILEANDTGVALLQCRSHALLQTSFSRFVAPSSRRLFASYRRQAWQQGGRQGCELELICGDGNRRQVQLDGQPRRIPGRPGRQLQMSVLDITVRKQAEAHRHFCLRLLNRLQQPCEGRRLMCDLLMLFKEFAQVEAVGLRLREGNDFPFHEAKGFSPGFLEAEQRLFPGALGGGAGSCYRQMAARVACRFTDKRHPFFTEQGSFWTPCLSDLLASPGERVVLGCTGPGREADPPAYESVAIIPLCCGDDLIGLLQLHDRRPGLLNEEQVHFLEQAGAGIVMAVKQIRDDLQRQQDKTEVEHRLRDSDRTIEELRWEIAERQRMQLEWMDQQQQLQALESKLFMAEERERRRLAALLHDQVGALLATICLKLGNLREQASPGQLQQLTDIQALLRQAVQETQAMTFELASPVLYELGLSEALAQLVEQTAEEHGVRVETALDNRVDTPDLDARNVLFQGARELLSNVIRHARARTIRLTLRETEGWMELTVEDDGIGFDPAQAGASFSADGGFGLFNLRRRLQYLGGSLQCNAAPGRGARLTMRCPRMPAPAEGPDRKPSEPIERVT